MTRNQFFLIFMIVKVASVAIGFAIAEEEQDVAYYQCINPREPDIVYYYDEKVFDGCVKI